MSVRSRARERRRARVYNAILTLLGYVVEAVDFLSPKDSKTALFGSNTGEFASGSPKALHDYMQRNHANYRVFFYRAYQKSLRFHERIGYIIRFAPTYFRAKFLVSSHPPKDFFPFVSWSKRKTFINTWHGIPLKSMFFADIGETTDALLRVLRLNEKTSVFIVSSKLEKRLIRRCFHIDSTKIYCLGHPRNDILLKRGSSKKLPSIIRKLPEYRKVILYCPTYRRGASTAFFPFDDFDLEHLNLFLEENKLILLIREHYYRKASTKRIFSKRIIDFGFNICGDVNPILSEVDILITDYSSLYIDYLLLDRPCIFIPYDLETYRRKRGLLLDYDYWAPGHKVLTYAAFEKTIQEILSSTDDCKSLRQKVRDRFHDCQTANSCEKVFQLIDRFARTQ